MTTYDLHQHLWPAEFVAALRSRTSPPQLVGEELVTCEGRFALNLGDHDPAERIRRLDADGIDVAVLSLQPSLGLERLVVDECSVLEETWVDGIRALLAESSSRFSAFSPSAVREGFRGVSLGSSAFLDLERAAPVLDAATAAEAVVFVHPSAGVDSRPDRPDWWEWIVGYPARMQEAYVAWLAGGRQRWPSLKVLFAMLAGGGPFQLERLGRQGLDVRSTLDHNTFLDVSTHGRRAIELCIETFGVGQLVYGSDLPVVDPQPTLDAVRGFGDAVRHVLQSDTPGRLLA